jgi:ATP-dependent helicase/nuclease subunit B
MMDGTLAFQPDGFRTVALIFFRSWQAYKRRMDLTFALPQQIADALDCGAFVVTANQRAARTLQHDFNLRQQALGLEFWEPPSILAWDAWLATLWRRMILQGGADGLLLSATQEHTIWRSIIAADPANAGLLPIDSVAETAAAAWLLLHQYRVRQRISAFPGNTDSRAFAEWATLFDRRCRQSGYVTQAQLPEALRTAVIAGKLELASRLLLVGFDSKTPAQIALIEAVEADGRSVVELQATRPAMRLMLADAASDAGETTACANWILRYVTQYPGSRVAVIVPDIDSCRAEVDREFRAVLAPELNNIETQHTGEPYEFSLGVALSYTPLAVTALDILRWAIRPLPIERISLLLLSPSFAVANNADDEYLARAEFDAFAVRQQHLLQPSMTVEQLLRLASDTKFTNRMPALLRYLRLLAPLAGRKDLVRVARSYADWAATFNELLNAAGWAPLNSLNSVEFQTRRKWEGLLDELTTLDFDSETGHGNFASALEALVRIADGALFAPESRHVPIQIMGPLESAGSTFDALWFLRANDLSWPAVSVPNALLSWQLQRELEMPGANPAHDATYTRRITERIAGCASTVIFSYAHESAEGHQRPSTALAGLTQMAECHADEIAPPPPSRTPITLDIIPDDVAIPFPPDRVLQGGAAILQAQAACGFKAFAEKRLFATPLESLSLGLDPSERGSLIHAVLEDFWAQVKTQGALRQMTAAERADQLDHSIDCAFQRHHPRPAAGWSHAYIDAEHQRLRSLLTHWLDFEAHSRRPFAVKAREEKLSDVRIGPLRLDVRVDRIDAVELTAEDGSVSTAELIVDYKTGKTSPSDWLDERPDEPQLPLYAVVANAPQLAAIAFATIRRGKEMGLRGFQAEDGILPKASRLMTEDLATHVEQWRGVLERLAEDFHSGHALVSPKKYPQTCTYCAQRLLCRLDLSTLQLDGGADEFEAGLAEEIDRG